METHRVNAASVFVPTTGYSQAMVVAAPTRLLFVSGQTPLEADGTVPGGFEAQCRRAWKSVEAQLQAAGMTLDNLVMHRTYLADRSHAMANRAIRQEVLGDRSPAATVVVAGLFDAAWLVEIEAVAVA